jgi:hypothetical protein
MKVRLDPYLRSRLTIGLRTADGALAAATSR